MTVSHEAAAGRWRRSAHVSRSAPIGIALVAVIAACQPALELPVRNDSSETAVLELTTLAPDALPIADPIVLEPGDHAVLHVDPALSDWSIRLNGGEGWAHSTNLREEVRNPGFALVISDRNGLVAVWKTDEGVTP